MAPLQRRRILVALLFICSATLNAQDSFFFRGIVRDSTTNTPLVAINLRVMGTSRGTISNAAGEFALSLPSGQYQIAFSSIGYQPETLGVNLTRELFLAIDLRPTEIALPEVLVLSEDPAVEIVRKAIANKRRWMDKLTSYRFEAFTRQIVRRDTSIASIAESFTSGYFSNDTLREIIRQKRQTKNLPEEENLASVRRIVNFNDDLIDLFTMRVNRKQSSYTFLGPTAPEALEYYEYTLLSGSVVGGVTVYDIAMKPKVRTRPLFEGTISIAEGTFAVMAIDVRPNETFAIPFLRDLDLRYTQQFSLYDSMYWMPTHVNVTGGFTIDILGLRVPRVGLEITSAIFEYELNEAIPDSILALPKLSVDSSATPFDSLAWSEQEIVPLTAEENNAYAELDSSESLEKQFQSEGILSGLDGDGLSWLRYVDARFTRVEGFFFGGKFAGPIGSKIKHRLSGGYGFSDERFSFDAGIEWRAGKAYPLTLDVYRTMDHVPDGGYYGSSAISLMALIDKNDYRDYFLSSGGKIGVGFTAEQIDARVRFISEQHRSVQNATTYSLFGGGKSFRPNPDVKEGTTRSVEIKFRAGDEATILDFVTRDAVELSVERSSKQFGSDFGYWRYHAMATASLQTFAKSLLFSPFVRVRVEGGLVRGDVIPQRLFTLDSRASGYAPFGVLKGSGVKEFVGDRYVMVQVEHNFRSLPFLIINAPYFFRNHIELVVHAAVARAWHGEVDLTQGLYAEAGVGLSRILEVLRFDASYRFKGRRVFLSFGTSNLF